MRRRRRHSANGSRLRSQRSPPASSDVEISTSLTYPKNASRDWIEIALTVGKVFRLRLKSWLLHGDVAVTLANGKSTFPVPAPVSTRILTSRSFPIWLPPVAVHASKCLVTEIVPHVRAVFRIL